MPRKAMRRQATMYATRMPAPGVGRGRRAWGGCATAPAAATAASGPAAVAGRLHACAPSSAPTSHPRARAAAQHRRCSLTRIGADAELAQVQPVNCLLPRGDRAHAVGLAATAGQAGGGGGRRGRRAAGARGLRWWRRAWGRDGSSRELCTPAPRSCPRSHPPPQLPPQPPTPAAAPVRNMPQPGSCFSQLHCWAAGGHSRRHAAQAQPQAASMRATQQVAQRRNNATSRSAAAQTTAAAQSRQLLRRVGEPQPQAPQQAPPKRPAAAQRSAAAR